MSQWNRQTQSQQEPPAYLRPVNIVRPLAPGESIYIETASPNRAPSPPKSGTSAMSNQPQSSTQQGNLNDVAGVLRRNQACLNCRRRKLKCDAARPHCSTCVRSHKHLLRTAPHTNPTLSCDYDDAPNGSGNQNQKEHERSMSVDDGDDDEMDGGVTKKKKRKATADTKRKSKGTGEDAETEALRKKIESLEAQLASTRAESSPQPPPPPQPAPSWSGNAFNSAPINATSPTAFLEMLSSAASAQPSSKSNDSSIPGLRDGASETAMMSKVYAATPGGETHSGLTPFLSFTDNQQAQLASQFKDTSGDTEMSDSRRSSAQNGNVGAGGQPQNGPGLSPSGVFNFSPAPQGMAQQPQPENMSWPPIPGPGETLQPSQRTEGPWRGVETVTNMFGPADPNAKPDQQKGDINMNNVLFAGDEVMQQQILMDLFWPGWPVELPEPHIVNDLVEAFFECVPNLSRVLHRSRLLARLALPPTHSNFPHPALIHAICACAAAWCDPAIYAKSRAVHADVGDKNATKAMSFGLKQAEFGKAAVQEGLNTGNRLFDVVRAMIILCRVFIDDTRMLECWAYAGLVARMILPLGLNVRSAELSLKSVMLPPPADALEREERRAAVWMAFYHDTIASAASGWGTSMSLDELSVPLPVALKDFEQGNEYMESNPQDIESPDFWTRHPVPDPFVMCMKATVLVNRVNRFVRKWKNRHLREEDDLDGMNRPEFRELANAAACLQMSFPAVLRNPTRLNEKKKLDVDLITAHMIPQAAIICLYEPFADIGDASDQATRRVLNAAQSIVSVVQQLASAVSSGAQNFATVMHSAASVCLVTSARTSLLFYRLALNNHDQSSADAHRTDIEIISMALAQFGQKFKIGHHHAQLIEYFLDRASNPTYEKMQAHYPEHPRPGAPELHPHSNFGVCIMNALNVKRGYWKLPAGGTASNGVSPFGSTPDSAGYASNSAGPGRQSSTASSGGTGSASRASANLPGSHNSPHGSFADRRQSGSPHVGPSGLNEQDRTMSSSSQWFIQAEANGSMPPAGISKDSPQKRSTSLGSNGGTNPQAFTFLGSMGHPTPPPLPRNERLDQNMEAKFNSVGMRSADGQQKSIFDGGIRDNEKSNGSAAGSNGQQPDNIANIAHPAAQWGAGENMYSNGRPLNIQAQQNGYNDKSTSTPPSLGTTRNSPQQKRSAPPPPRNERLDKDMEAQFSGVNTRTADGQQSNFFGMYSDAQKKGSSETYIDRRHISNLDPTMEATYTALERSDTPEKATMLRRDETDKRGPQSSSDPMRPPSTDTLNQQTIDMIDGSQKVVDGQRSTGFFHLGFQGEAQR